MIKLRLARTLVSCRPQHPEDASRVSGDKVDRHNSEEASAAAGSSIGPSREIAIFPKGLRTHKTSLYFTVGEREGRKVSKGEKQL